MHVGEFRGESVDRYRREGLPTAHRRGEVSDGKAHRDGSLESGADEAERLRHSRGLSETAGSNPARGRQRVPAPPMGVDGSG